MPQVVSSNVSRSLYRWRNRSVGMPLSACCVTAHELAFYGSEDLTPSEFYSQKMQVALPDTYVTRWLLLRGLVGKGVCLALGASVAGWGCKELVSK